MNELLRQILFLPPQRSSIAEEIDTLHYAVIITTMIGATLVTLVGAALLLRYRRRLPETPRVNPAGDARPPIFLEVTAIVVLFTLFVVFWSIGTREFVRLRVAPEGATEIYVTAKQWMWKFAYPAGNSSIAVLYVPAGRPVKLIMTSRDVIHSFYVPDFRIKQDVLPGRFTTVWFQAKTPGSYQILCTEYCGQGHSMMRGEVVALASGDYERWLSGSDLTADLAAPIYVPPAVPGGETPPEQISLVRLGARVAAEQGCLRCHTLDGSSFIGPTWAGVFGSEAPLEGGGTTTYDEAYITESMMDPRAKIHLGFLPVMPSYQGRISPPETAAIIELIKALRTTAPAGPGGSVGGPIFGPLLGAQDAGAPAPPSPPLGDLPVPGPRTAAPPGGAIDGGPTR